MKNTRVWCLLGLLSLGSAAVSHAQQTSGATEKAVMALENQWLQSQKANNAELVAPADRRQVRVYGARWES